MSRRRQGGRTASQAMDDEAQAGTFGEYMESAGMGDVEQLIKMEHSVLEQSQSLNVDVTSTQNSQSTDQDEEDEVLYTMPVYLSQELSNNLYILQYPLRTPDRPYTDVGDLISARVKPHQRRVELEYKIDTESDDFYNDNADYDINSLTLSGTPVPPKSNYVVGSVRGGRVVLTPVHAVCRMMPSLAYIDAAIEEDRLEAEKAKNGGILPKDDDDDEFRPVLLKFKRGERAGVSRRLTYSFLRGLQEQENWEDLTLMEPDSSATAAVQSRMVFVPQKTVDFPMSANEYLEYLHPFADMFEEDTQLNPFANTRIPLTDRLKQFMVTARVASFPQVCKKLNIKTAEDAALAVTTLSEFAQLVQGNWVCRSEVLYNLKQFRGNYKLVLVRNYAIACFHETPHLSRAEISPHCPVSIQELTDILNELGYRDRETEFWDFKLPTDNDFVAAFPTQAATAHDATVRLKEFVFNLLQPMKK